MKKLLIIALAALFVLGAMAPAFAEEEALYCLLDHKARLTWPPLCPKPVGGVEIFSEFIVYYQSMKYSENAVWYVALLDICDDYAVYVEPYFDNILDDYQILSTQELTEAEAATVIDSIEFSIDAIDDRFIEDATDGRQLIPNAVYNAYMNYVDLNN